MKSSQLSFNKCHSFAIHNNKSRSNTNNINMYFVVNNAFCEVERFMLRQTSYPENIN